jgi:hypothetical protein
MSGSAGGWFFPQVTSPGSGHCEGCAALWAGIRRRAGLLAARQPRPGWSQWSQWSPDTPVCPQREWKPVRTPRRNRPRAGVPGFHRRLDWREQAS